MTRDALTQLERKLHSWPKWANKKWLDQETVKQMSKSTRKRITKNRRRQLNYLADWSQRNGVPVFFEDISYRKVHGYWARFIEPINGISEVIVVDKNLRPDSMIRALLHEITHSVMHREEAYIETMVGDETMSSTQLFFSELMIFYQNECRIANCEVEAETVAYLVGHLFHLDKVALDFSEPYIKTWLAKCKEASEHEDVQELAAQKRLGQIMAMVQLLADEFAPCIEETTI